MPFVQLPTLKGLYPDLHEAACRAGLYQQVTVSNAVIEVVGQDPTVNSATASRFTCCWEVDVVVACTSQSDIVPPTILADANQMPKHCVHHLLRHTLAVLLSNKSSVKVNVRSLPSNGICIIPIPFPVMHMGHVQLSRSKFGRRHGRSR